MKDKQRLDMLMVEQGFAATRQKAQYLIKAGNVSVNGIVMKKTGEFIADDSEIAVIQPQTLYVGRGGYKLKKALEVFDINIEGRVCLDVGASTGGFTDCMLQKGAKRVYAVDVGTEQLDSGLKADTRVISMENTDIRKLEALPEQVDFTAADVSFISLSNILPSIKRLTEPAGDIVVLVKPQFEAGHKNVGKKGIVKDPKTHKKVLETVLNEAVSAGLYPKGLDYSPITGTQGNIEYLLHLCFSPPNMIAAADIKRIIEKSRADLLI